MKPLYLDYNATTPVAPEVRDAILPYLAGEYGNPSSSHTLGKSSREAIENARRQLAALINAEVDEIFFTSGGTESSNLAIQGTAYARGADAQGHLVISAIEHPATIEPAKWLARRGFGLTVVGCGPHGVIDPAEVAAAMREDTVLVSVMHANNEVGTIQPIAEIAAICRQAGAALHVDAAQSIGKIPVDVDALGVDLLTIAGHKFYAPKGIGALYVRRGTPLEPPVRGAGHERGLRPGTENTPYIAGLGMAAKLARESLPGISGHLAEMRDRLEAGLRAGIAEISINAEDAERLPNTLSVNFPGVVGGELLEHIPELCASTGAACHSGSTRVSATLAAMSVSEDVARGTIRLSVGRGTHCDEIDMAVERLVSAWRRMA